MAELRCIREALEQNQPLGFGKRAEPVYVFVRYEQRGNAVTLWYRRDKTTGVNQPIVERDLTGTLANLWRFDRVDETTHQTIPRLNIQVHADHDTIIQTGFYTNFSKSLLAGLLELPQGALAEPLTLVLEDNQGSKARPTVFCRVEHRGLRMTPALGKDQEHKALYQQVVARFGFRNPYAHDDNVHDKVDTADKDPHSGGEG